MNRRTFLSVVAAGAVTACAKDVMAEGPTSAAAVVRVVVWDEQQPEQKRAYDHFLGNAIAGYLRGRPGFSVQSVAFADAEQGLAEEVLDPCDVLVWWSHYLSNPAITTTAARKVVDRIKAGKLSLITLHSADWSEPFVQAMRDRAAADALKSLSEAERKSAQITFVTPKRFQVRKRTDRLTPSAKKKTAADGTIRLEITLPNCVFPAYRADGMPSHVTTLLPNHPIASGLPLRWDILQTEMYDEPFHVPPPDEVVFEEKWDKGEHFRSGCVWKLGKGRVFYFRPGHETYPVYKQELPLRVIDNACRWLASVNGKP